MIVVIKDDFDLPKIAGSGQCFRWYPISSQNSLKYIICSGERELSIAALQDHSNQKSLGQVFEVNCSQADWDDYWYSYFDLKTNYSDIRQKIRKEEDPYLYEAAEFGKGIRILRQDPWETLICFLISQRKSIPAIQGCVKKLCEMAGAKIHNLHNSSDSEIFHAFPSPDEIASLTGEQLTACGFGYRSKYIAAVSRMAAEGTLNLSDMQNLDDEELLDALMELPGVGIKVASCVMLFGFHRLNAFPKDVWINRILQKYYTEGFPFERYHPYCGVMQQYLFYYARGTKNVSSTEKIRHADH